MRFFRVRCGGATIHGYFEKVLVHAKIFYGPTLFGKALNIHPSHTKKLGKKRRASFIF